MDSIRAWLKPKQGPPPTETYFARQAPAPAARHAPQQSHTRGFDEEDDFFNNLSTEDLKALDGQNHRPPPAPRPPAPHARACVSPFTAAAAASPFFAAATAARTAAAAESIGSSKTVTKTECMHAPHSSPLAPFSAGALDILAAINEDSDCDPSQPMQQQARALDILAAINDDSECEPSQPTQQQARHNA